MSDRIPAVVVCCNCGTEFRARAGGRREVVAWVRAGRGGSLSNPRGQHFTGRWACNRCTTNQLTPAGELPLEADAFPGKTSPPVAAPKPKRAPRKPAARDQDQVLAENEQLRRANTQQGIEISKLRLELDLAQRAGSGDTRRTA